MLKYAKVSAIVAVLAISINASAFESSMSVHQIKVISGANAECNGDLTLLKNVFLHQKVNIHEKVHKIMGKTVEDPKLPSSMTANATIDKSSEKLSMGLSGPTFTHKVNDGVITKTSMRTGKFELRNKPFNVKYFRVTRIDGNHATITRFSDITNSQGCVYQAPIQLSPELFNLSAKNMKATDKDLQQIKNITQN